MTSLQKKTLLDDVAMYYTDKLNMHGESPNGVDWNGEEGQYLRFAQLTKIIAPQTPYSVNDLGCGYGALYDFLMTSNAPASYFGTDISEAMIGSARKRHKDQPNAQYFISDQPSQTADYSIASGIFNVCLDKPHAEWLRYIEGTLDVLNTSSRRGFSFNCLTCYSDEDKKRPHLYYADPCYLFDMCKKKFSKQVALLHDYGLYEFTILVRKNP